MPASMMAMRNAQDIHVTTSTEVEKKCEGYRPGENICKKMTKERCNYGKNKEHGCGKPICEDHTKKLGCKFGPAPLTVCPKCSGKANCYMCYKQCIATISCCLIIGISIFYEIRRY